MAELRRSNKALEWERLPDGRLAIAVSVVAELADGTRVEAPEAMFILSQEEEDDLRATLTGIQVAHALPAGGPAASGSTW